MTVTSRQLSILAATAALMIVVTIALYGTGKTTKAGFEKGPLLIQGLDCR